MRTKRLGQKPSRLYVQYYRHLHQGKNSSHYDTRVKFYSLPYLILSYHAIMVLVQDLLHPTLSTEAQKHKLKTLVQAPRSFFMDVKCAGCLTITTVFSHAQTAVSCDSCSTVLCIPTGGMAKLTEGCSFRRK